MKSYYYVNVIHGDNVRIDGTDMIVSLQGRHFKSVKVHSAVISSSAEIETPLLRLNTYSGNGFSTNRKGVVMCLYDNVAKIDATDYRFSINNSGAEYFISDTLNELSFSILDGIGAERPPLFFESVNFILELEEC